MREPSDSRGVDERAADHDDGRPRIGVYVCRCGGNIGDVVRCDDVAEALSSLPDVVVSRSDMSMCSDPGQQMIADDIAQHGVNRVVVGACSMFLHEKTFRGTLARAGLNPYLYEHVGLREQDSWVHGGRPDEATEKAVRLMSAGISKARGMRPLEPVRLRADQQALVVGGGVAGLRAALSMARMGLGVTLIEKSHFLGGHAVQLAHTFAGGDDARAMVHGLIDEVRTHPAITVHTGAQVVHAEGYVGNFAVRVRREPRGVTEPLANVERVLDACPVDVTDAFNYGLSARKAIYRPYEGSDPDIPVIDWSACTKCGACRAASRNGSIDLDAIPDEIELRVGSVVIATGFQPYEPAVGEMGYGEIAEVVTLPELERMLDTTGPTRGELVVNGHAVRSMAMIHCVGSRQLDGVHEPQADGRVNDYCSRVCCTATLGAANRIRERWPDVQIYDVYEDIRTYGRGHEDEYARASRGGVTFLRFYAEDGPDVRPAGTDTDHPVSVTVRDHLTWGEEIEVPVDLVVLAVGMMPNPVDDLIEMFHVAPGTDRFLLEVHPKLRPVETAVHGIVIAGTAQGPMSIQESCASAEAASAKIAGLLGKGEVELEPFVASVDLDRCEGDGACVQACPQDGAIELVAVEVDGAEAMRAHVTPANCNGCGVCVSVCPHRAVDVQGWRLDAYEAMVDALVADVPNVEVVS